MLGEMRGKWRFLVGVGGWWGISEWGMLDKDDRMILFVIFYQITIYLSLKYKHLK